MAYIYKFVANIYNVLVHVAKKQYLLYIMLNILKWKKF